MNAGLRGTRTSFLLTGCLIYFLLLLWVDLRFLTIHYNYIGFVNNLSVVKILQSLLTFPVFFLFLKKNYNYYPVNFFCCLIIFIVLIPALVHFSVTADYGYYFINILSCLIVFIILSLVRLRLRYFHLFSFNPLQLMRFLLGLVFLFIGSIVLMGGWKYFNLNFARVYEYRAAAANNLPAIFNYFFSVIAKVIIPVIIILALHNKKKIYALMAVICAFLEFGLLSHKGILFNPFVTIFIYLFLGKKDVIKYMLLALIIVCVISIVDFYLSEVTHESLTGWFGSLFARRVLMVPPLLNDFYIQFFSVNSPYYWCSSKVSFGLIECPYPLSAANTIGEYYFGSSSTCANIGWIGAGFSNMRLAGTIIYSVMLGLILCLLISFTKKLGVRIVLSTSFLIILNILNSTDIFTAFITHGLFYLLLIYLVISRNKVNRM